MRVPITVPEYRLEGESIRLGEWTVSVGDCVDQGECLAELIFPGLTMDLAAPTSGQVTELLRQPEQCVRTGEILGWLEADTPR